MVLLAGCAGSSVSELTLVPKLGADAAPAEAAARETAAGETIVRTAKAPSNKMPSEQVPASAAAASAGSPASEAVPSALAAVRKSAETAVAANNPSDKAYRIGPLDVLDISVFSVPELSKSVQVSEAGSIGYPLVGEVEASGKTAREIEATLTKSLGAKYLQRPQVTVFIKEYNSQRVTIDGAVRKPGVFPVQGSMSLLQAIAFAQGVTEAADDSIVVFRTANGVRSAARFDIGEIRAGNATDPQLVAGDVVVAGKSAIKEGFNNLLKLVPAAGVFALL